MSVDIPITNSQLYLAKALQLYFVDKPTLVALHGGGKFLPGNQYRHRQKDVEWLNVTSINGLQFYLNTYLLKKGIADFTEVGRLGQKISNFPTKSRSMAYNYQE